MPLNPQSIIGIGRKFMAARVLLTAAELDEFTLIAKAPLTATEVASRLDLYRKVNRALRPSGRLIIRDHVMSPDHTQPASGTLFAVNMLVVTAGGSTYSYDEIRQDLESSGFTSVKLLQTGEQMDGLVEAFKL